MINTKSKKAVNAAQRESLLKPNFRKPSVNTGRVEKKTVKTSSVETRHVKMIQQKQSIAGSRLNLLRALNKVKTEQDDDIDTKYQRSDEDCSDQSSYDGIPLDNQQEALNVPKNSRKRRSPVSTASSDSDLMKNFPPLPEEPAPKLDYTQEEFLSIFMLITPDIAESIKHQRTKRKKRNCLKNEKNDFHYGNFDLNEVS
jgi:hypothetical protein